MPCTLNSVHSMLVIQHTRGISMKITCGSFTLVGWRKERQKYCVQFCSIFFADHVVDRSDILCYVFDICICCCFPGMGTCIAMQSISIIVIKVASITYCNCNLFALTLCSTRDGSALAVIEENCPLFTYENHAGSPFIPRNDHSNHISASSIAAIPLRRHCHYASEPMIIHITHPLGLRTSVSRAAHARITFHCQAMSAIVEFLRSSTAAAHSGASLLSHNMASQFREKASA